MDEDRLGYNFYIPRDPRVRSGLGLSIKYGNVRLTLTWEDDRGSGSAELDRVLATMPQVLHDIRKEVDIRKELAGMDDDIEGLLDDE